MEKPARSEAEDSPACGVAIRIAPRGGGPGHRPVLSFCYEEGDGYDPQIYRVRVARVDDDADRRINEIAAVGDRWLWKEWVVGAVPRGFRRVAGDTLVAGVYEVYVDAFVGEGMLRMSIDDQGEMRSLPWDNFDTGYGKQCPPVDRKAPRIIPKGLPGKEGILEKNARELRERRRRGWRREGRDSTQP